VAEEGFLSRWPVEYIPNEDSLYMRVHRTWFKPNGQISPGAFQNRGDGMSTDWSKYSTPEETRLRARKAPGDNAVVAMVVKDVRAVPGQQVEHTPLPQNQAHTDVRGEKDEEARVLIGRIAAVTLPLSEQKGSSST